MTQPRDPNPGGSPDAWETSEGRRLVPRPSTIDRLTAERDAARADNAALVEATVRTEGPRHAPVQRCLVCTGWGRRAPIHRDDCPVTRRASAGAAILAELTALRRVRDSVVWQSDGTVHCQLCGQRWGEGREPEHWKDCPAGAEALAAVPS